MNLLTLPEFAAVAANAVQASGAVPDNRQAKAIPAERMVRYYTARGLLPRPGTRGRALTYGRTHLVRLVAVKRLQGQGLSLDEIADRLEGMPQAELESLAAIPPDAMPANLGDPDPAPANLGHPDPDPDPAAAPAPSRVAQRFWATAPQSTAAPAPAPTGAAELRAVRLSDTVTLLIDGLDGSLPSLDTLRDAAAPLLDLLGQFTNNEGVPNDH
jgi:DNA-binding transcriptional MerR regulator